MQPIYVSTEKLAALEESSWAMGSSDCANPLTEQPNSDGKQMKPAFWCPSNTSRWHVKHAWRLRMNLLWGCSSTGQRRHHYGTSERYVTICDPASCQRRTRWQQNEKLNTDLTNPAPKIPKSDLLSVIHTFYL